MKLRKIRIVLNEVFIEPIFSIVLVFICLFIFACFIGVNNIAFAIDNKLCAYSEKNGVATLLVSGESGKLYKFIDEQGYTVYRVGHFVNYATLGFDPDYVDKESGDHRYLSGSVERVFLGGTSILDQMNKRIICGTAYDYSDNENYCIWLSELSATYIGVQIGDEIVVNIGNEKTNALVKGIYQSDPFDNSSNCLLSDFYLSAVFLPNDIKYDNLEVIIPELNLKKQSTMQVEFNNNGFQTKTNSSFESLLRIKLGFYLVAILSCIISVSIMVSMTKIYINKRKSFYSTMRLLGLDNLTVILMSFLFFQILYTVSFILSLPVIPIVFSRVIGSMEELLGNGAANGILLNLNVLFSYLIISICNVFSVLVCSKNLRQDDISICIKMGVEG